MYRVMNKHVATQAGWNSVGFQYGLGSRGISSRSKAQWTCDGWLRHAFMTSHPATQVPVPIGLWQ